MSSSTGCAKNVTSNLCKIYPHYQQIYQQHQTQGCPSGIFNIISGITCHISSGIASGLGGIGSLIDSSIFKYGLESVLNQGSYQALYGFVATIALMGVVAVWFIAMIRSLFIRKESFTKEPIRITVMTAISVMLIVFKIPVVITEFLFYLSTAIANAMFTVGFQSIVGSAHLLSGNSAGVLRAVIEGGAFELLGGSLGWLFLILLVMLIALWVLCIAVLVISEAMGLFMLVLFPFAASTLALSFGKRFTKELAQFITLAAFSQVVAVIVMLLSWVFLLISLSAATK
ncbi:MAG: hypothetical protein ACYCTG_05480 [Ferrimicrobium sp.]